MWNWLKRLFGRKEEQCEGDSKDCPRGRIIVSQLPRGTNCSIVNSMLNGHGITNCGDNSCDCEE